MSHPKDHRCKRPFSAARESREQHPLTTDTPSHQPTEANGPANVFNGTIGFLSVALVSCLFLGLPAGHERKRTAAMMQASRVPRSAATPANNLTRVA